MTLFAEMGLTPAKIKSNTATKFAFIFKEFRPMLWAIIFFY